METAGTFNLDLPDAPPTARCRIKAARLFIGLGQTNQFLRGKKKKILEMLLEKELCGIKVFFFPPTSVTFDP